MCAARSGDRAAFRRLYESHAGAVRAVLLARRGVTAADADDLTQEVFLTAWSKLHRLRDPSVFGPWVLSIARRKWLTWLRWGRARPAFRLVGGWEPSRRGGDPVDRGGDAERVLRAIRALPGAYRETLVMRLVEGMSGPMIAARTGLSHGSVRVNLTRGMALLRQRLRREDEP